MKAYGVKKADAGCCGGHDKYPPPCLRYEMHKKASKKRRADRPRKKTARQLNKKDCLDFD